MSKTRSELESPFIIAMGRSVYEESKITTLALNESMRGLFFRSKPQLFSLLQRQTLNPPIEEGTFATLEKRERQGEYFITGEALTFLIDADIKKYQEKYNTKNIFIIDNNFEKLCEILNSLNLKPDEDAKFIFINNIHAIAFYLRAEAGKVNCYMADSTGSIMPSQKIALFIKNLIADIEIVFGPRLQKDYYSCYTFAKKTMVYFIKHGHEIFSHIATVGVSTEEKTGEKSLTLPHLMAPLLKLCQSMEPLPEALLNILVSTKANKTLRQYHAEYKKDFGGKTLNTASIQKRYKYFEQINQTLIHLNSTETKLTSSMPFYHRPQPMYCIDICQELYSYLCKPETTLSLLAQTHFKYLTQKIIDFQRQFLSLLTQPSSDQTQLTHLFVLALGLCADFRDFDSIKIEAEKLAKEFKDDHSCKKFIIICQNNKIKFAEELYVAIKTFNPPKGPTPSLA